MHAVFHILCCMQALYQGDQDTSFMQYDQDGCSTALQALFHDMGSLELKGNWCRCWSAVLTQGVCMLLLLISVFIASQQVLDNMMNAGSIWAQRMSWRWTSSSTLCQPSAKSERCPQIGILCRQYGCAPTVVNVNFDAGTWGSSS